MATLTKYDSFEALKANTGSGTENLRESNERHKAFEKFINLLQAQVSKSKSSNTKKGAQENKLIVQATIRNLHRNHADQKRY